MADGKAQGVSPEELRKNVDDYKARRQSRLDEAEKAEAAKDDAIPPVTPPAPGSETPDDKVKLVKERLGHRDREDDPETPESALGVID